MERHKQRTKVPFDELASERLTSELCNTVDQVELQVKALPRFLILLNQGYVTLTVNLRISAKKLLLWLSTLGGFAWGASKVIVEFWPTIKSLLDN